MSANRQLYASDAAELQNLRDDDKRPRIVSGLNRPLDHVPLGEQTRAVRRQQLMVVLGNLGLLATGMSMGLPSITLKQMTDPNEQIHLSADQATWFASVNSLCVPIGGLLTSILLDRVGRKMTILIVNVLCLLSWGLMALTIQENSNAAFIQLMASRCVVGVAMGLGASAVGVYAAEISLPRIRGCLILGTSVSVALGILIIFLIGYFIRDDWHLIASILCGYQILSIFCLIPMPESPSWLLSKGREAKAKKSLNYFRGLEKSAVILHPEVAAEFSMLQKNIQLRSGEKNPSFLNSLRLPEVHKPLVVLIGLFTFQQLTGVFVVIVYAVQIATEAGVSIDPFMCAVLIGLARVITTCPMGYILETLGRRRSGIISALGMSVCMFVMAANAWWEWLQNIPYLPVVAVVAYIVLSTIGIYTLPFMMVSELFPQKVRGPASGLSVAVGMFISFLCVKTYPGVKTAIGTQTVFLLFALMAIVAAFFVYFLLPETRGRSLIEIEENFRDGEWLQNGRKRRSRMQLEPTI